MAENGKKLNTLATSIRSYVENNGPCNIDEIATDTFITKESVRSFVDQLVEAGEIIKKGTDTYE